MWTCLSKGTKGINRARLLRYKRKTRQYAISLAFVGFLWALNRYIRNESNRPVGCGVVQVWSHRGHLDSSAPESKTWTCDHVLQTLQENGIRHLDVDLIYHQGKSMVAHPTELQAELGDFSPSPCSKLPLADLIGLLNQHYGDKGGYMITMEPKSAWKEPGPFLAAPQDVITGILDVLDEHPIPDKNCGIILDTWQAEDPRVNLLMDRIEDHCQLVTPLRKNQAPLEADDLPPSSFSIIMPTIELFGGTDGKWWLKQQQQQQQQQKSQIVVWVVDTMAVLQKALQLKGVNGVISNNPVKLKAMYDEVCATTTVLPGLRRGQ